MKTTDLIPILLYHLKDSDKYGLELVEVCDSCSNGKIVIKQPTLYSVLKKLEKSRFITSYWKDSDIGGKRHYYKITENGLSQLDTYPPLEDLIKLALEDEEPDASFEIDSTSSLKEIDNKDYDKESVNPFDNISLNFNEKLENIEEIKEVSSPSIDIDTEETDDNDSLITNIISNNDTEDEEQTDANTLNTTNLVLPKTEASSDKSKLEFDIFDALSFDDEDSNKTEKLELVKDSTKIDTTQDVNIKMPESNNETSIEDNPKVIDETKSPTNSETDLELTNPFFKDKEDKTLKEKSTLEINQENTKLLNIDDDSIDFATDKKVSKFTQKQIKPATESDYKTDLKEIFKAPEDTESKTGYLIKSAIINSKYDIPYKDYIDFKTDANIKLTKQISKLKLFKTICSSILSLALLILTFIITIKNDFTTIYWVFSSCVTLYIVFYLCKFIGNYKINSFKDSTRLFSFKFKKQIIFRSILFVCAFLIILILNLTIIKNSLFSLKNFGNFLAPIILSLLLYTDYFLAYVFYRKINR